MLKNLLSRLLGEPKTPSHFYGVYIQCEKCDEKISTRINLRTELSVQYGETDRDNTYFVRKQLLGKDRCFNIVNVELTFDNKRNLIEQQISGGRFISEDNYLAEGHDQQPGPAS